MHEHRTKGAIVRSKTRWVEHGEKNTKYSLNLEKRNSAVKVIHKMKSDRDTNITDQNAILTELVNYYAKLYNASARTEMQVKELENYIERTELPKLNENQKLLCDNNPITLHECKTALYHLRTNKSPGLDGFSVEFYKAFWDDLKQCFLDSINFSASTSILTKTQYQGVITLIPKPGKDHSFPYNYRPITLLNCDYKIISKVINNRLTSVLHSLIGNEQNGFIKGGYRPIGYNIRLLFDFIDCMDHNDDAGTLLSLDVCKAFDSLK